MTKNRVPIPKKIETELLYQSARTCCVCRTPKLPLQIHHIDQDPSNNELINLILLCQNCHDEAHTKHALSQNLTPDKLKEFKAKWIYEVQDRANHAMLPNGNMNQAMWTFVNHQRLPQLLKNMGIDFDPYLKEILEKSNIIDHYGIPILPNKEINKLHVTIYDYLTYDNSHRLHLLYTKAIDKLILHSNPIELGAIWSKQEINALVKPGSLVYCMKGMYFKSTEIVQGIEDRYVHSCSKGIEIRFYANTRHMFGTSALYNSFSGQKFVATLLLVKNIDKEEKNLIIDCTPMAMGYGFMPSEYDTPHSLKYGWKKLAINQKYRKN